MLIDEIMDILRCPCSGGELRLSGNSLICDQLSYPIVGTVPVLLIGCATKLEDKVD